MGTIDIFLELDCPASEGRPENVLPALPTGEGVRRKSSAPETSAAFFSGGLFASIFLSIVIEGDLCPLVPMDDFLLLA